MTATKSLRVLVSGDVEGNISQLYARVNNIQKKSGNFDVLLCVGDFFGSDASDWENYKSGKLKAPISTLILGPCKPELGEYFSGSDGTELCHNITYLGRQGRYTESSGLQIAYLSGLESEEGNADNDISRFGVQDAASLLLPVHNDSRFQGVDILLTSQWPRRVEKYASDPDKQSRSDSVMVAEVARVLRPRYHFAGCEGTFYERQPYRNHQVLNETARHVTRFVGMANVANKEKKKYLYAFSITPMSKLDQAELNKQPADVTECPYLPTDIPALRPQKEDDTGPQFFYDMSSRSSEGRGRKRQHHDSARRDGGSKQHKKPMEPTGPCWFCLGSPQVEKHLVVSVGTLTYLALAKGGLVPEHVLILPIQHHQSTVEAPAELAQEIEKYKSSLRKCFKAAGKAVVFFERNYKTQHLQIQVVPVPGDSVQELKDTFMQCAESESFELHEIPKHSDLKQIVPPGAPYFYAEIPTGERLLHRISQKFPLQYGREVLAEPAILNMPERVDWRSCQTSKDEEARMASDFKATFRAFDFNFD